VLAYDAENGHDMTPIATPDRESSELRFARAVHRHGLRHARGFMDANFAGITQASIASAIGLSRPTVSTLVKNARDLLKDGRTGVQLNPEKTGYVVGIDFGQAHHRVALADVHGQQRELPGDPGRFTTRDTNKAAALSFDWAAESIALLLRETKIPASRIWALGVSLPGPVNARTGRLHRVPQGVDPSWELVDVVLPGEDLPSAPVIESDYNASGLTEHLWGATRDQTHALYVKVSQRCACSLLIDHRIYRGSDGLAGRLGKTQFQANGKPEWELVEDVFSLPALRRVSSNAKSASQLVEAAKTDAKMDAALRRGARALGVALAPIIDALNPETVVIGGALGTASFSWIASDLLAGINDHGPSPARHTIAERLAPGSFASGTAIRGAMASALLARVPDRVAAQMAGASAGD
jgi:predicted NBD/HSP70 family sugar kinase